CVSGPRSTRCATSGRGCRRAGTPQPAYARRRSSPSRPASRRSARLVCSPRRALERASGSETEVPLEIPHDVGGDGGGGGVDQAGVEPARGGDGLGDAADDAAGRAVLQGAAHAVPLEETGGEGGEEAQPGVLAEEPAVASVRLDVLDAGSDRVLEDA